MVDVGSKPVSLRRAVAEGEVRMRPATLTLITKGGLKKGDVLAVARVAAIQAAKKTAELIPLCHPIPVSAIYAELIPERSPARVRCRVTVTTSGQTGVEMEALTAVSAGLLTVYDMCKAVDRGMVLGRIRLLEKSGGQSGDWRRAE